MDVRFISTPCQRWKIICNAPASAWKRARCWDNCTAFGLRQFKTMARLLFWISAGFIVYVYIGYPILLWALQAVVRAAPRRRQAEPSVSLLVAAYNEAGVI